MHMLVKHVVMCFVVVKRLVLFVEHNCAKIQLHQLWPVATGTCIYMYIYVESD